MKGTRKFLLLAAVCCYSVTISAQTMLNREEAVKIGLNNNFSIRLQGNNEQIARNNNTLGNAGFWPSVTLNATQNNTISTTHQEQFSGTVKDVDGAYNNSLNLGLQLNWTVFDGMRMFANKNMLETLETLGVNGTRLVMENFVSEVANVYYGIVQLQKLTEVNRDAVALSMQRKDIASAKVSLGSGSQLMLMQSTVDLNADSIRLIQQLVRLDNLMADMNRLLGRDIKTPFLISDSIIHQGLASSDTILHLALSQNAQLITARLNQDLAQAGLRQSQAERYPWVNLNAGYTFSTLNAQTGFLQYNRSYGPTFGINLSYNLFDGFNVSRAVKNARIAVSSSDLEFQDAELMLRNTLLKLENEYEANSAIVKLEMTNIEVARENVVIAFEKYKLGSINDIELREIQRKLIEAEYQLISSQYELKKAELEISRYCGTILNTF